MTTTAEVTGRILPYQKTSEELAAENDTPMQGERVRATDTGLWKTGDGETPYNDLPFDTDIAADGDAGQVLTSQGPGQPATWATMSGGGSGGGDPVSIDDVLGVTTIGKAVAKAASQLAARNAIGAGTSNVELVDEDDMASDSPGKAPSQQSVRAFVLAQIAALIGAAPPELDTWIELVAAIQDDQSAIAAITAALAARQEKDPTLTALAAVATAADKLIYATGPDTFATTPLTDFIRTLLDDATPQDARGTLGLGSLATVTPTGPADSSTVLYGDGVYRTPPSSGGSGGGVDSVASLPGPDITTADLADQLAPEMLVSTYVDNQTRNDVALSVSGAIGLVITYMGALQDIMVKLTDDQTVDGVKTFLKALSAHGVSVVNDAGGATRIELVNSDAGQSYEIRVSTAGQFTLRDSTHGRNVFAVDANAPDSAIWVQGDKIVAGAPLSMGGLKVTDAADPTAPQEYGTKAYIDAKVAAIVNSAPATLDTLDELANALGDDPNFAATVSTNIGLRALKSLLLTAGTGLTGGGDLSTNRTFAVVYGNTAGSACQGNDSRLSDARTPTAHTHAIGDTNGLQAALDAKAALVESVNVVNASGAAQTIPDPATGVTMSRITLTANCALTFPAPAAGKSISLALAQDGTGSRTVTWPATVKWPGGTAPTLTTTPNKTDRLTFLCDDGGTWAGFVAGLNFS